jgi:Lysozyme like domain
VATYPYSQLEGLWIQAGGPKALAPVMAAIALAESDGQSTAQNPSGATGLWQINGNPFPGDAFDPLTNAKMAVAKYREQGLGAWTTYTSGAYKQFLRGGVSASVPAGGFSSGGGGGLGGLLGFPSEIVGAFTTAGKALDWLVQPSSWVRILSGWLGTTAVLSGLVVLAFA